MKENIYNLSNGKEKKEEIQHRIRPKQNFSLSKHLFPSIWIVNLYIFNKKITLSIACIRNKLLH